MLQLLVSAVLHLCFDLDLILICIQKMCNSALYCMTVETWIAGKSRKW